MNRCLSDQSTQPPRRAKPSARSSTYFSGQGPSHLLAAASAIAVAVFCAPASAQGFQREFPTAAKRAVLEVTAPPEVLLNGAPARLSPGARIHGVTNTLVMSGQMVGQRLVVNYVRDTLGLVHQVWILSPDEAQKKRPDKEFAP